MKRERKDLQPGQRVRVVHDDPRWNGLIGIVKGREHNDPHGMVIIQVEVDERNWDHWFDDWNLEVIE